MKIKGFQETTLMDWRGMVAAIVFVGGCNFRCAYCHNHQMAFHPDDLESIPERDVLERLKTLGNWIDGVIISGGEPTLYEADLKRLLKKLRERGLKTKLFTNGSCPEVLAELLSKKLLDAVSMDLKHVPAKYEETIGMKFRSIEQIIIRSVGLLKEYGMDVEFRMTVVKGIHTHEDIREAKKLVYPKPLILQNVNANDIPAGRRDVIVPFSLPEFEALQKELYT